MVTIKTTARTQQQIGCIDSGVRTNLLPQKNCKKHFDRVRAKAKRAINTFKMIVGNIWG